MLFGPLVQALSNYHLTPRLRFAIRCALVCLVAVSLRAGAQVGVSKHPLSEGVSDGSSQAPGWFTPELGLLIGIVMIALIVIVRNRNAP